MRAIAITLTARLALSACGPASPIDPVDEPDPPSSELTQTTLIIDINEAPIAIPSLAGEEAEVIEASGVELAIAGGTIGASGELGTAAIVLAAGSERAAVRVIVADVADGVLLLDAEDVATVDAPVHAIGQRAVATLERSMSVGDLVMSRGAHPLAGRVVSVAGQRIEVEVRPLDELFDGLELHVDEPLETANLLPTAALSPECDLDGGLSAGDVTLDGSIRPSLRLQLDAVIEGGQLRLAALRATGTIDARLELALEIPSLAEVTLSCQIVVARPRVPVSGLLALLVSTRIPLGVGFDAEISIDGAQPIRTSAEGRLTLVGTFGVLYTPATGVVDATSVEITRKELDFDAEIPDDLRLGVELFAYGFANLAVGLAFTDTSLDLATVKAGLRELVDLDTPEQQGELADYASKREMQAHTEIATGSDIAAFLRRFGAGVVTDFKADVSLDLDRSPTGAMTCRDQECESAAFSLFDDGTVPVRLDLDGDNLNYLGEYIVDEVRFYSIDTFGDGGYELLATVPALEGQTQFDADLPFDFIEICRDVEAFVVTGPYILEVDLRSTQRIGIGPGVVGFDRADCF